MNRRLATLSFFPFLLLFALPHDPEAPPTPQSVLQRSAEEMSRHTSMAYDLHFRMKFMSSEDTLALSARVKLVRRDDDTIAGGLVWYSTASDSFETFYDLRTIYWIDHGQGEVRTYEAHDGESFMLRDDYYRIGFFSPMKVSKALDKVEHVTIAEEAVEGNACWKIVAVYPDEEEVTEIVTTWWIDRGTFLPRRCSHLLRFQGEYQYDEWTISNVRFDEITVDSLAARNDKYLDSFKVTPFVRPTEESYALLADGTTAPDFSGRLYGKGDSISLADEPSRLIILDFWYSSCYPCMQAMPHLQEIFAKYRERGVTVWGVNSVDGRDAKREARLPKFFTHNPVDYPIIFVDRAVDSLYNVKAFPSLYLLDAERRIVFSQSGFSEDLADRLDSVIGQKMREME